MKYAKLITLFLLPTFFNAFGSDAVTYGVIIQEDKNTVFGNPFLYPDKRSAEDFKKEMNNFKIGKSYSGLDKNTNITSITLTNIIQEPEGDLGESLFEARKQKQQNLPILFWTSQTAKPINIKSEKSTLTKSQKSFLEDKTKNLFQAALNQLSDPEYKSIEILNSQVLSPLKTDILTVFFPLRLKSKSGKTDNRASAFFLYNPKTNQIILGKFGHPEWSPEAKNVNIIKPIFFLSVNNIPYCFCQYDASWEHSGFALIELLSGKIAMTSY